MTKKELKQIYKTKKKSLKAEIRKEKEEYLDIISLCLICADKLDFINTRYDITKLKEEYLKKNNYLNIDLTQMMNFRKENEYVRRKTQGA